MKQLLLVLPLLFCLAAPTNWAHAAAPPFGPVQELLQRYCLDCHSADEPQAGFDLSGLDTIEKFTEEREALRELLTRVRQGEMPPEGSDAPTLDERDQIVQWAETTLREAACGEQLEPGPAPLRRLNRTEYSTTLRDLLGIHFDAGHGLPADGAGGAGFDNAAETLFLSPVHAEKYLEAAKEALDYAAKDEGARKLLLIAKPNDQLAPEAAARQVLERFATRAFRRPVEPGELDELMPLFQQAAGRGEPFEQAVFYAMQAVLISPHFLFRIETPNESSEMQPVNDYELATRLSYFLWSTMPDDQLFQLARENKLHDEAVLEQQVVRMLKDSKARGLATNFAGQWLGTRELGRQFRPDPKQFQRYDHELETAMREEPIMFFQEIVAENRSLLELLDADYTYVNRALARHYGIEKDIDGELQQQLRRVSLPEGHPRGGILTMAGVLTVSSYPNRTSPVLRGKWILENLLGSPPPPPPPDAGELPEDEPHAAGKTLRERLLAHRRDPTCASCHQRLDPLGFALENFDAIGRWRTEEAGKPIDASGELPGGIQFEGPVELKKVMLQRREEIMRHLVTRLLSYALGRGLVDADHCTVDQILERLKEHDYRSHTLILEIVRSAPFRYKPPGMSIPEDQL